MLPKLALNLRQAEESDRSNGDQFRMQGYVRDINGKRL